MEKRHVILVTGSQGFIGRHIVRRLSEQDECEVITFSRDDDETILATNLETCDFVIHLAGVNRPSDDSQFDEVNYELTEKICRICDKAASTGAVRKKIIFSSSIRAERDDPYGRSKLRAETVLQEYAAKGTVDVACVRLPGVFGKWCRPNYNSVVATFCHNIANGKPIVINDDSTQIEICHIDDVVKSILSRLLKNQSGFQRFTVDPSYKISLLDLSKTLSAFAKDLDKGHVDNVAKGLCKPLYSTYLSYLPYEKWQRSVDQIADERGMFSELFKNTSVGQFSVMKAAPGQMRGGHYHHTKAEKFFIVSGRALFRFRNIETGEYREIEADEAGLKEVITIPGWAHDIVNIGDKELISLIWANEIFDHKNPDTFRSKVVRE